MSEPSSEQPETEPRGLGCTAVVMRIDAEGRDVTNLPGLHDESDRQQFACRVCGKQCDSSPPEPERAVCETCCEDHEYEYDRGERDRFCKHCGKRVEPDWYRCDDDVY